jgi:Ca2+-binding RTX toxin-like protein
MRRILVLLATMVMGVLLASGVALAANITCPQVGGTCTGTANNDQITGSLLDDQIQALGGRDEVNARSGDDEVDGGRGSDDIFGRLGGDLLIGGGGPDDINGGRGTSDASDPPGAFPCFMSDPDTGFQAFIEGDQFLRGGDGNDGLDGGIDSDFLRGDAGRNVLSGNGGADCLRFDGDANERASGGDGDDIIFAADFNADEVFCGAGFDAVQADPDDLINGVAASSQAAPIGDCEYVDVV